MFNVENHFCLLKDDFQFHSFKNNHIKHIFCVVLYGKSTLTLSQTIPGFYGSAVYVF